MSSESKSSFFRQSAWMVVATVAGGVGMMLVHSVVAKRGDEVYAEFATLLRAFYLISAAAGGLLTVFGQQTASAITEPQIRAVRSGARQVLAAILVVWVGMAVALMGGSDALVRIWKLTNPAALWATLLLGMLTLWMAVLRGLLQGRQNFLVFGWVVILDGLGRFAAVTVILLAFGGLATGAISGALLGTIGALAVAAFGVRDLLLGPGDGFQWRPWLRRFVPLTIGAAAIMFLQIADVIYLQSIIPADRLGEFNRGAFYVPAAQIGFALTQFTVPLALVMFPRLARSAARAEKSDALALTMKSTLLLGGLAALGCTLLPKLPLQVLFFTDSSKWAAAPIVPWYAWSMLAWTLANVLLNSLLARDRYVAIPWVTFVAVAYGLALWWLKSRLLAMSANEAFLRVVQTLGFFNLLLFLVGWWFTRAGRGGVTTEHGPSGPAVPRHLP